MLDMICGIAVPRPQDRDRIEAFALARGQADNRVLTAVQTEVAEAVELLDIAERLPGLCLDAGAQAGLDGAMLRLERGPDGRAGRPARTVRTRRSCGDAATITALRSTLTLLVEG